MDVISSILPATPGLLPKWLFIVAGIAAYSVVQNYLTVSLSRNVYTARPQDVNGLSTRSFGTWTALSTVVRAYAAYNITNPVAYDLCIWSFAIAQWHFLSEWLLFGTADFGPGVLSPLLVSGITALWMITQRGAYV